MAVEDIERNQKIVDAPLSVYPPPLELGQSTYRELNFVSKDLQRL